VPAGHIYTNVCINVEPQNIIVILLKGEDTGACVLPLLL
jgi:hypothetical protein